MNIFGDREQSMKKFLAFVLVAVMTVFLSFNSPALAGNAASGAKIFSAICASCHLGGGNIVRPNKSLKKSDLERYGNNSLEAIVNQVTKGKGAMPAFRGRLTDQQIEDVAAYVLEKAEKGW